MRPDRYSIVETLCVALLFENVDQKDTPRRLCEQPKLKFTSEEVDLEITPAVVVRRRIITRPGG